MSQTKAELIKGLNINASAPATALNIDSSGRVGIGTTSPGALLTLAASVPELRFVDSDNSLYGTITAPGGDIYIDADKGNGAGGSIIRFAVDDSERARIDSSGRLLVGTSTAAFSSSYLTVKGGVSTSVGEVCIASTSTNIANNDDIGAIRFTNTDGGRAAQILATSDGTWGTNDYPGRLTFSTTADGASSPTERMRINSSGSVLVGGAIPQGFGPSSGYMLALRAPSGVQTYLSIAAPGQTADTQGMVMGVDASDGYVVLRDNKPFNFSTNNIVRMTIAAGGSVSVVGALSKGSGSFRIDHPLPEKKDTHQLVHSFIEGPQADLIYRGHVCLVNGKAQVNIDEAAQMTEGTFETLCRDVCCFTTNESDWTPVRGSVTGNILTIEAQDPASCADVCWLVIGERKDQHMLDTDWTDENGKVITEPLKETSIPETA